MRIKKTLKRLLIIYLISALFFVVIGKFPIGLVTKPIARHLFNVVDCFALDGDTLTAEDFDFAVSQEFLDGYNLFRKMFNPIKDSAGESVGTYHFQKDVLLKLQKVVNKEMTVENEWEVMTSQLLITIGYLSDGDIHKAYLEAKKALTMANIATITKDEPEVADLNTNVAAIEAETMSDSEVMAWIDSVDDALGADSGIIGELAFIGTDPDIDSLEMLIKSTNLDEKEGTQLLYPKEGDEVYAPITFKGKVYGDPVRYWIQYWEDTDEDGVANADSDVGSSWQTVEEVEVATGKTTREKIISSIEAGTTAMFLANTYYVCRIYSVDSDGIYSADPDVINMSGIGNGFDKVQDFNWQGFIRDRDLSAPPASPSTKSRYIVKSPGTGDWSGHDSAIAEWNGSAWDFVAADTDMGTTVLDENIMIYFDGTDWEKVLVWSAEMVNGFKVKAGKKPAWWMFWLW